ncbi:hypothetical protein Tco_1557256, partial [Tanacetum coccineum]
MICHYRVLWASYTLTGTPIIIHVNLTQENLKSLEVGKTLDMTYSVMWTETNGTLLLLTSQCS